MSVHIRLFLSNKIFRFNIRSSVCVCLKNAGGGILPYMGYIGMCGPRGYGFSAVLVINRVSNLADSGHK